VPTDTNSNTMTTAYLDKGKFQLAYRTVMPTREPQRLAPHVVFCGGFHSNMQGTKATALEHMCVARGLGYTRFDYRGHGESDGEAGESNLSDWLEDTLTVLATIDGPLLLIGSSMGGWLAVLAAMRMPSRMEGLLLLASAPDFLQELVQPRLSLADTWDLQQGQTIQIASAYDTSYPLNQSLLDSGVLLSLFKPSPETHQWSLEDITCPVHLIHGTGDSDVPYELSIRLLEQFTQTEAQLSLLRQADHRLSDKRSLDTIELALDQLLNNQSD